MGANEHVSERFRRMLALYRKPDGSEWGGQELENATGGAVTRSYVRNLKKGRIENPGLTKLEAISGAMGFPPALWFGDADEEGRIPDDALLAALEDETTRAILEEALRLRPKDRRLLLGIAPRSPRTVRRAVRTVTGPERKPSRIPYLRFGETERPIMGPAVEIVGNAKGLLQLRTQIDRALKDVDRYPLDEALYRDEHEEEHQVVVRRARSREEMRPPLQRKSEKVPEKTPWAELALERETARTEQKRREVRSEKTGCEGAGG